ncbi:MAG: 2-oxoacid:acceptor oxidoreductase family protein [Pseudomonadota bacterium]
MKPFNIFLIGVGGQGIGMLSEVLLRAADHAGLAAKGVDTHGLAQRGGIVRSRIRIGDRVHSPLIGAHQADLAVALERHEALRAIETALRDGGTLIFYDAVWQPLGVRVKGEPEVGLDDLERRGSPRDIRMIKVFRPELTDAKRQNIILLANILKYGLLPGVEAEHFRQALEDLMTGPMLEKNLALFDQELEA